MPPPRTPGHSRNSSAVDSYSGSPQIRRFSKSSANEPSTPSRNSFNRQDSLDLNVLSSGGLGGEGDMGNLADELADAFSDSGDDGNDGEQDLLNGGGKEGQESYRPGDVADERGSRGDSGARSTNGGYSKLELPSPRRQGHRITASAYDGSDYGSESDLESPGMPAGLVAKIDGVESLARRGAETYGGPADEVIKRVTEGLRDLGSQSSIEGSASRLITAHSALATHLAHQTRQLHNLTFALLSPLVQPPGPDTVDELVPLLAALSEDMPRPSTSALSSLSSLQSLTTELVQTLNYLSDTLHMSRQTTSTATRRLRSAKELVAEMRREEELREEGERWLARGNWGERLRQRECAGVCGDVIGGFEEVCNGWRERLLAQAEPQA